MEIMQLLPKTASPTLRREMTGKGSNHIVRVSRKILPILMLLECCVMETQKRTDYLVLQCNKRLIVTEPVWRPLPAQLGQIPSLHQPEQVRLHQADREWEKGSGMALGGGWRRASRRVLARKGVRSVVAVHLIS